MTHQKLFMKTGNGRSTKYKEVFLLPVMSDSYIL